ncbi:MAG: hypothetical protein ACUVX1_18255 [Chloroflexota bacterium]
MPVAMDNQAIHALAPPKGGASLAVEVGDVYDLEPAYSSGGIAGIEAFRGRRAPLVSLRPQSHEPFSEIEFPM